MELTWLFILLTVTFLFFSALLSGSEIAFFSLSPKQILELKKNKSIRSLTIIQLLSEPKRLHSTLLIGNILVNILIILFSALLLHPFFTITEIKFLDLFIEVGFISMMLIFYGEVMPKFFATRRPLQLATYMAIPIASLNRIFYPLSASLAYSREWIEKNIKPSGQEILNEDLASSIDRSLEPGTHPDEKRILKGIAKFGEVLVKQIMKPRSDVIAFEYKTLFPELLLHIQNSGHSRVPVFEGNFDKIVGILYIKDLLAYSEEDEKFKWQSLLRTPYFVPESKKINSLLKEFQRRKNHMAIVVNEFGASSGLVTLEDILEEIVGEINDEFDDDDLSYSRLDPFNFVFDGKTSMEDVLRIMDIPIAQLGADLPTNESLSNLVSSLSKKSLSKNEILNLGKLQFVIEAIDRRKIQRVKVTFLA